MSGLEKKETKQKIRQYSVKEPSFCTTKYQRRVCAMEKSLDIIFLSIPLSIAFHTTSKAFTF